MLNQNGLHGAQSDCSFLRLRWEFVGHIGGLGRWIFKISNFDFMRTKLWTPRHNCMYMCACSADFGSLQHGIALQLQCWIALIIQRQNPNSQRCTQKFSSVTNHQASVFEWDTFRGFGPDAARLFPDKPKIPAFSPCISSDRNSIASSLCWCEIEIHLAIVVLYYHLMILFHVLGLQFILLIMDLMHHPIGRRTTWGRTRQENRFQICRQNGC